MNSKTHLLALYAEAAYKVLHRHKLEAPWSIRSGLLILSRRSAANRARVTPRFGKADDPLPLANWEIMA